MRYVRPDGEATAYEYDREGGRWSQPVNLLTALHDLGVQAILAGARAAGRIEVVEQEIFGVSQQLHNNTELRRALEPSRCTSTEDRVRLARQVFSPVISPAAKIGRAHV